MTTLRQVSGGLQAPEGIWTYFCERLPSLLSFSAEYCSKLIVAELKRGAAAGTYVLWNVHATIFIYNSQLSDREPLRRVELRQPLPAGGGPPTGYITCLSFSSGSPDEYDLLIGLSNGEIRVISLGAQLSASSENVRPVVSLSFNPEGNLTSSRCVAIAWVPGGTGASFISAHADGGVFLHQKIVGNSSDTRLLARTASDSSLRPASAVQLRPVAGRYSRITDAAISPKGDLLALACRDGVLRVLDLHSGSLVAGFKSYYGGLQCCAWSADGCLIAAGGEDDLIAIWSLADRDFVAHLQGHSSWVSAIAFDPWGPSEASLGEKSYRLASVGQDCSGMLWDVAVTWELGDAGKGRAGYSPLQGSTNRTIRGNGFVPGAGMEIDKTGGSNEDGSGFGNEAAVISPALPRAEMNFLDPVAQLEMHIEPLCDVFFQPHALLVSSNDGSVKRFLRPPPPREAEGQHAQQAQQQLA